MSVCLLLWGAALLSCRSAAISKPPFEQFKGQHILSAFYL